MKILCNYGSGSRDTEASLIVNRVGKYIYKHLPDAERLDRSENMNDVYFPILFELKPEYGGEPNDTYIENFDINITTYQNKIRVNLIRMDEYEKTISHKVYKPEELVDLHLAFDKIMFDIETAMRKEYRKYNIIFDVASHKRPESMYRR